MAVILACNGALAATLTTLGTASANACVYGILHAGISCGLDLEQGQTKLHASSDGGRFSLSVLRITDRLWARVPAKGAESELLMLSGLIPADQRGVLLDGAQFTFTSAPQTQYGVNGSAPDLASPAGAQAPFIASLQPASGLAGSMVKVFGHGFLPTLGSGSGKDFGGNTVHLGSDILIKNQNSEDGLKLQFQVPANTAPGTYSVSISNENGDSNAASFMVTKN